MFTRTCAPWNALPGVIQMLSDVIERLENMGLGPHRAGNRPSWKAYCPGHHDENKSLTVGMGDHGRVLMHCHAGCSPDRLVELMEMVWQDFFNRDSKPKLRTN